MASTCVRAAGQGGGHGGSGGHGSGGHAGHFSGGSSSGHSSGHSIGHSLAHIFGHHGEGASPAALKGASPEHRKATSSLESVSRVLDRQPSNRFVSGSPICFFPRRRAFGLGGCPYGWVEHNSSSGGNWNCSNDGFFFDPFFSAWFSRALPYGSAFGGTTWFRDGIAPDSTVQSPAEPNPAHPPTDSDMTNEIPNFSGGTMHHQMTLELSARSLCCSCGTDPCTASQTIGLETANCITRPRMEAKTRCPSSALILRRR